MCPRRYNIVKMIDGIHTRCTTYHTAPHRRHGKRAIDNMSISPVPTDRHTITKDDNTVLAAYRRNSQELVTVNDDAPVE